KEPAAKNAKSTEKRILFLIVESFKVKHKFEFERKYRRGQKTMIQTFHQVAANVSRCHILQSADVFQPD
ncbi:hypothetical protein, partial [Bacteroides ovatus]|uniref:hypothetical protein n=1 Tax=Bacteroides ovatus TaxID=28116 RepID=UPI00321ABCFA